jgi:hypothetical protein
LLTSSVWTNKIPQTEPSNEFEVCLFRPYGGHSHGKHANAHLLFALSAHELIHGFDAVSVLGYNPDISFPKDP